MRKIVWLACVLVTAPAAGAQWKTNFAANPSFEADRNRDGGPDGWVGSAYDSPAKVTWDRAVGHGGGASVRISNSHNPAAKEWNERSGGKVACSEDAQRRATVFS